MPKRLLSGLVLILCICFTIAAGTGAKAAASVNVSTDMNGNVTLTVSDASLEGAEMSVVCYDPSWNGAYTDWAASKSHIVYMGQSKISKEATVTFKINKAVEAGNYTVLIGAGGQKTEKKFSFISGPQTENKVQEEVTAEVPTSVKAVQSAASKVKVTWKASAGAVKYTVYRSGKKDSGYVKAGEAAGTSYTDKKCAAGKTYYYKVSATAQTKESALSTAAKVKLMSAPKIKVKVKAKNAVVSWKKIKGVKGYKVYTSNKKKGKYKLAATLKKASKVKCTVKLKGKKGCYIKVRAYKKNGKKTVYGKYSAVKKAGKK